MYSGFPRSIYILFIVRIINSMGNFVYPFLTFFLTDRIGLSAEETGTYFLASAVSQVIGSIIGGKITDHYGRKKFIVIFLGLSASCFLPCSFLGNSILIPILLILSGFFSGAALTANMAMVTDLSKKDNRKQVFSLLYMGSNIGFAIGPMIAGFLYKNHTNWIFYGNSMAILISIILIVLFIEETMPANHIVEQDDMHDDEIAEEGGVIAALAKRPLLLLLGLGRFFYQLVYSSIIFGIPLQLKHVFGSSVGPQYYGIIASFNGVVVIIFTIFITKITMKLKPLINLSIAGLFYAVGFGMIGFADTLPFFLLAVVVYTIGEILDMTNSNVYIANHSPVTHRGRFNAVITMISNSGFAAGPYLFGKFISLYGIFKLWLLCFILAVISSLFIFCLRFFEVRNEINIKDNIQL